MTDRETPNDLDAYLPDAATADAVVNGIVEYNKEVDPKLRARLEELNRLSANPGAAPPSVAVHAEITVTPGTSVDEETTLPPKVMVTPPSRDESPTQPSLKRLEGEPELPGGAARTVSPRRDAQRLSVRTAVLAVLAVLVPVLLVIFFMGRTTRPQEQRGAASATTASVPATTPTAVPSAVQSAMPALSSAPGPAVAPTAVPAPSTIPSSTPLHAPPAPPPTGAAMKPKQRGAPDDPYDTAPTATAAPTSPVTPPASPPSAPTAAPAVAPTAQPTAKPPRTPKDDDDVQIFHQPTPPSP